MQATPRIIFPLHTHTRTHYTVHVHLVRKSLSGHMVS